MNTDVWKIVYTSYGYPRHMIQSMHNYKWGIENLLLKLAFYKDQLRA